ncbi:MAG TPA: guanylate kinase [Anaeromyxobacteraceae bacterium]|nr:guanylate kinase [Anaeromyxobacteraceae bacterium]
MSSEGTAAAQSGQLLVISAPSGAGKTTLARLFVERTPDAFFSVSATTRAPRGREQDGVDYRFLEPSRFRQLVADGAFAEWAEVHGHLYGTPLDGVWEALRKGRVAVFDIDVQGGSQLKRRWPEDTVAVLVVPPTPRELERRLRQRSTDSEEAIAGRLAAARAEVALGARLYDYVVVNDALEVALASLVAISEAERGRRAGRPVGSEAARSRRDQVDLSAWIP